MSSTPPVSYVRCFSSRHWQSTGQNKHYGTYYREIDEYYPARHRRMMVLPGEPEQFIQGWDGDWHRAGSPWHEGMEEKLHV